MRRVLRTMGDQKGRLPVAPPRFIPPPKIPTRGSLPRSLPMMNMPGRVYAFSGFGSIDPQITESFTSQMNDYQAQLLDIYKTKAKAIADREGSRFKYLTAWRSVFESVLQNISQAVFSAQVGKTQAIFNTYVDALKSGIPMVLIGGGKLASYSSYPMPGTYFAGGFGYGLLSPVMNILVDPYQAPSAPDQRPLYLLMANEIKASMNTAAWDPALNWPTNKLSAYDYAKSVYYKWSNPPSELFMDTFAKDNVVGQNVDPTSDVDYLLSCFSVDYGRGSLNKVLDDGFIILSEVVSRTMNVIKLQYQIDALEHTVSDFVSGYQAMGVGQDVNVQALLAQIDQMAQAQVLLAATQGNISSPVPVSATLNPSPASVPQTIPTATPVDPNQIASDNTLLNQIPSVDANAAPESAPLQATSKMPLYVGLSTLAYLLLKGK